MDILTQTITSQLDISNKFCMDWNHFGTVAYSSLNTINILDSYSMKIIRTIVTGRNSSIVKLKWSVINFNDGEQESNNRLKLASVSDDSSSISIWSVKDGRLYQELIESSSDKSIRVTDLKWALNSDILTAIYSDNRLVIWHTDKGMKISERSFSERIEHFALDPHDFLRIALIGTNMLILMNAESPNPHHESNIRRFSLAFNDPDASAAAISSELSKRSNNLFSNWKIRTSDRTSQNLHLNECLQVEFHSNLKNFLLLVYPKEVFLFDLIINQTVGCIQIDRSQSQIIQIYPCYQMDSIYTLQENGSITFYARSVKNDEAQNTFKTGGSENGSQKNFYHQYTISAQSDSIRLTKNSQIFGFLVCPVTEKNILIFNSDGRVLKYELFAKKKLKVIESKTSEQSQELFLAEINAKRVYDYKIALISMHNILPNQFILRISPEMSESKDKNQQPLVAVGCMTGALFIYNLNKAKVARKFAVFNNSVVGMEWCTPHSIILWSHNQANSASAFQILEHQNSTSSGSSGANKSTLVRNEIVLLDIRTGQSVHLRKGHEEESIITSIKVSKLRQYLIILFKEQPLEIWDLRNFALIKKISRKSPHMTVLVSPRKN